MNIRIGLLLGCLCSGTVSLGAGIGTWRSFTSMNEVRDVVRVENRYWAATGGGLFTWESATNQFGTYTNAEGLISNDLTATIADDRGNIWTGAADGLVHVLLQGGSWTYILDISEAEQTSKRINRFEILGDTLFICTDFGLSMYDAGDFLFGDTYTKFGSLSGVRVAVTDALVFQDSIWAVVSDGLSTHRVAVAALANPNRLPAEAWELRTVGSTSVRPTVLAVFQDVLYAGTTTGLYSLSNGQWTPVAGLQGVNVVSLDASGQDLLLCSPTNVYSLTSRGDLSLFPLLSSAGLSVTADEGGAPVVGSIQGLLTLENDWVGHVPNGPASNQFVSVTVDLDGNVWSATGISGGGRGISRFDGSAWKSYTVANAALPTNDYYKVSVGCTGSVWASSWGWGVLEVPRGADVVDTSLIYDTNVGMLGLAANPDYIVVSDVACDPATGNEWMSINSPSNGNVIAVRHGDGETWTMQPLTVGTSRISTLWYDRPPDRTLAVDAFGNLWGVSKDLTYKGVFTLSNRGQISDDISTILTEQDGLPSREITTLVIDKDNDIWVGTERGIGIILDPNDPQRPGAIALYKPLNGIVINSIAVDALNRKWVGTPDGVILLSPDGIQQIESYTVESTGGKLISNDIRSIAIDNRNGVVYFGTLEGLSGLTTAAADPVAEFDELIISPNPYLLPASSQLLIDGLVENSTVKILGIDGSLVREIVSPGGRVGFWDGKDKNGNEVASGIYIVVAYSADGSRVAKGKVAVVRR
jgi:ligand-binding sensor domain-containing protein